MPWRPWLLPAAWLVLALPPQAMAAQSAATFWALNCRGCHSAPPGHRPSQPPGVGQFAQTEGGRIFFFDLPADGTPMPRWGEPEEVAKAVVACAAGELPYTAGQPIAVDGGLTLSRF